MAIYQRLGRVSYTTWGSFSVLYNRNSGNTHLVENIPAILMEFCFSNSYFDEQELYQNIITDMNIDDQLVKNSLTSFVKMDLLEKVEN